MKQRVECSKCKKFIKPVIVNRDESDMFNSYVKESAKCEIGKRVMFRTNYKKSPAEVGYFRFCEDFE